MTSSKLQNRLLGTDSKINDLGNKLMLKIHTEKQIKYLHNLVNTNDLKIKERDLFK